MNGRVGALLAGLALAIGGGVAGAALVSAGDDGAETAAPAASLALAADAKQASRASARRALRTARRARRIARRARSKANEGLATATALLDDVDRALADSANALTASQQSEQDAASALQVATNTGNRLDSTQMVSQTQNGLVQTAEENEYEALGGPQVTVNVPSSGLIELWATVTFGDDGNASVAADGAVGLFQDGQRVTEVDEDNLCQSFTGSPLENMLLTTDGPPGAEIALSTPGSAAIFGCGAFGSTPSPILLQASPGTHTYELRYGDCGCEPEPAGFKERTLRVAPHL